MITKEELIATGADKLATILLSLYQNNIYLQEQLDIIFAGLNKDPQKIVDRIKKKISSFKQITKFFDYREADTLASNLDQLRLRIVEDLFQKSSQQALNLLLPFLDLQEKIFAHVDDSNGAVGDVFIEACADLGTICKHVPMPIANLAELIFTRFMSDQYGIYDGLILNFKDVLREDGLKLLQKRFEQSLNTSHIGREIYALKDIADCQKDADAYIRACTLTGKLSDRNYLEISKRLIEHERIKEALQWLDKVDRSNYGCQQELYHLKIHALESDEDYQGAQAERFTWFKVNFSADVYQDILGHAEPTFRKSFREEAIQKAFQLSDPHTALSFLIETNELEESAKLVRLKIDSLDGNQYYTLRPAASLLQDLDPFAATLLHRKMIQSILESAKSKYYHHAAKELVICRVLVPRIKEWENHPPHDEYLLALQQAHKRKVSFWAAYQSAIQSQASKKDRD